MSDFNERIKALEDPSRPAVGAILDKGKERNGLSSLYDTAFTYLANAREHDKQASAAAVDCYVRSAFHFLGASGREESEKSRKLVLDRVAHFMCRTALLQHLVGIREPPVASSSSSVEFLLSEGGFFFALAVTCEECAALKMALDSELKTIAMAFYRQSTVSTQQLFRDSFHSYLWS
jgi:hypothetical protein